MQLVFLLLPSEVLEIVFKIARDMSFLRAVWAHGRKVNTTILL